MWQNVPFLCDPARTDAAFTSPNGEHKTIDFCKIDYPTLIDYAAKRREQTTICNFTLSVFEQVMANGAAARSATKLFITVTCREFVAAGG